MAENGRILHHLRNNIENPNNIIVIVGFMAQNTLGRKLVEKYKDIKIFGKSYKVEAKIKVINAFSAHADYSEIKIWLKESRLNQLKKIFLVHGEPEALNNLRDELRSINISSEVVEQGIRYKLA
jgi:metallo-beta-lactamase family protein